MRELAVIAPFDRTAQHGRAAGFDGLHHSPLMQRQIVRLAVGGAVLSKDVGHLQRGRRHACFGALGFAIAVLLGFAVQRIQRTDGGGDHLRRHSRVMGRGVDAAMAE